MAASTNKISPAAQLHEDGWLGVFQFLDGNEIARIRGVSMTLSTMCKAPDIWANAISIVTLPQDAASFEGSLKWRLFGKDIVLKCSKLSKHPDNNVFQAVIQFILLDDKSCPKLENLILLQLSATLCHIKALVDALQSLRKKRENTGNQLKKLVLELTWIDDKHSRDCGRELSELIADLPEEVEFRWVRSFVSETEMHHHYQAAVLDLISYSQNALKFTLPGCFWANHDSNNKMFQALGLNTTVQSLTFRAPIIVDLQDIVDRPGGRVACLTRMLVHPTLRHLDIADRVISPDMLRGREMGCNYTALYYANPEDFSKSTLETLHIELGQEASRGLLPVLHCVADMPNLQKFTISWPAGKHPVPQQISMERLRKFLTTSELSEVYKKRCKVICFGRNDSAETVQWSTLSTIFI
jgi:hypothetical protein